MGLRGELGPLDVQVSEKDELARFGSGLETVTALNLLTKTAFASFERYLVDTIQRSGGQISTKTAAELATNLTVGLVAPISAQIDPIRLGREQRAMEIGSAYAARLSIPLQAIARLTAGYPDHGFVIDLTEAREFMDHARPSTAPRFGPTLTQRSKMEDYRQTQKEYQRLQGEILEKRAAVGSRRDEAHGSSAQPVPESALSTH